MAPCSIETIIFPSFQKMESKLRPKANANEILYMHVLQIRLILVSESVSSPSLISLPMVELTQKLLS